MRVRPNHDVPNMRFAMMPTLFASVEASSIESMGWGRVEHVQADWGVASLLTGRDDDRFSDRDVFEDAPHVALHLRVDPSGELVNENDRRVS